MILLIDAGNTRIKLGWLRAATGQREDEPVALGLDDMRGLARWVRALPAPAGRALGVNVAGADVARAVEQSLGCAVEWVQSAPRALGVRNAYQPAGRLGADRWTAMLGLAWHLGREPAPAGACAVLASFGTATTIDTLCAEPDGEDAFLFRGGLILPGPAMMLASLASGTANLPSAQGDTALYPTHTHQAIATGVAAAQGGALARQWLAGLRHNGLAPAVYATGGGWPLVRDEARRLLEQVQRSAGVDAAPIRWLRAPVLDGLARLAAA